MATNLSKNTATPTNLVKPGQSYAYDSYLTYDADTDIAGRDVLYEQIGYESSATNLSKNTASPSNQAKS